MNVCVVPEGSPVYHEDGSLLGVFPATAIVVVEDDCVVEIESVPTIGRG